MDFKENKIVFFKKNLNFDKLSYNITKVTDYPEISNNLIVNYKSYNLLKLSVDNLSDECKISIHCDECRVELNNVAIYFYIENIIIDNKEVSFDQYPCICEKCFNKQ